MKGGSCELRVTRDVPYSWSISGAEKQGVMGLILMAKTDLGSVFTHSNPNVTHYELKGKTLS